MIFAGVWLEADHMNQTIWDGFGLEKLLSRTIYDHVGTADVVVESSAGTAAVAGPKPGPALHVAERALRAR